MFLSSQIMMTPFKPAYINDLISPDSTGLSLSHGHRKPPKNDDKLWLKKLKISHVRKTISDEQND